MHDACATQSKGIFFSFYISQPECAHIQKEKKKKLRTDRVMPKKAWPSHSELTRPLNTPVSD